jgi:outer membrane protein assembly factor BamD (BamD/ComL family)
MFVSFNKKILLLFLVFVGFQISIECKVCDCASRKISNDAEKNYETKSGKKAKDKKFRKDFKKLTFDQLEHNKEVSKKDKDLDTVARIIEQMINLCKKPEEVNKLPSLRLELADTFFDLEMFAKATPAYKEFVQYYPGHEKAEYAAYRVVLSLFNQTLSPDHDQTMTNKTIKAAKEFLKNETYKTYENKVLEIVIQSNKKLLKHEINTFNHYLTTQKNLTAAENRLKGIKKDFFKDLPDSKLLAELEEQLKAAKEKRKFKPTYLSEDSWWNNLFSEKKKTVDDKKACSTVTKVEKKKKSYGQRF